MKYYLNKTKSPSEYWNGNKSLPDEINVISHIPHIAEFELLTIISNLHGYITAFDILTGSDSDTEKDKDITSVLTAFQMYSYPKMPLSNYSGTSDKRNKKIDTTNTKIIPVDPTK
jgi:hypothetical protein